MAIFFSTDLRPDNIPKGRLLGMDLGTKTIGLALSDSHHHVVTPLKTIKRSKFTQDLESFRPIVADYDIAGYVIGWPLNMTGTRSPGCDRVQSFADEMTHYPAIFGSDPWILLFDERLSTSLGDQMVDGSVDKDKAKERGQIDALAAQIILQDALRYIRGLSPHIA